MQKFTWFEELGVTQGHRKHRHLIERICQCQCQCQSKFFSVAKIAELLQSPHMTFY